MVKVRDGSSVPVESSQHRGRHRRRGRQACPGHLGGLRGGSKNHGLRLGLLRRVDRRCHGRGAGPILLPGAALASFARMPRQAPLLKIGEYTYAIAITPHGKTSHDQHCDQQARQCDRSQLCKLAIAGHSVGSGARAGPGGGLPGRSLPRINRAGSRSSCSRGSGGYLAIQCRTAGDHPRAERSTHRSRRPGTVLAQCYRDASAMCQAHTRPLGGAKH